MRVLPVKLQPWQEGMPCRFIDSGVCASYIKAGCICLKLMGIPRFNFFNLPTQKEESTPDAT
jgi:hypothetical protein